jgi:hypothetical protein
MAKSDAPKTTKLVFSAGNGDQVNVTVADDDEAVERLVAGGLFAKASSRRTSGDK